MAQIIVIGAATGGVPAGHELKHALGAFHKATLVNASGRFQFGPSNPWVAVGWRQRDEASLEIGSPLEKRGIESAALRRATRVAAA